MAFNAQEQKIIEYGKKNGKTRAEVEQALLNYRAGKTVAPAPAQAPSKEPGILESLKQSAETRADKFGEIMARENVSAPMKTVQALGQGAGMAAEVIEKPIMAIPGVKQATEAIGSGLSWVSQTPWIKAVGEKIGENKTLQEMTALYDTDPEFKDTIDAVGNLVRLGMDVQGAMESGAFAKKVTNKLTEKVTTLEMPKFKGGDIPPDGGAGVLLKNVKKDIIPSTERFINTEITKALDLTQGDVKNIALSTGNDVGEFVAQKNLIGNNVEETSKKINDFYKQNYETVRSEIGKVKKVYDKNEIPAYQESLGKIKEEISGKIGLQNVEAEIDTLLKKNKMTLSDIQRAKELMDEHFSLYKATGDVKEGVVKEGLVNIRKELKNFIEEKVKKETGTDISELNNNVMTARSIEDAIQERSTRGLTRATISATDLLVFLTGSGVSLGGGAIALLAKKLYESPSFKLRLVKMLDGMTDAGRAKVKTQLEQGVVPEEIQALGSM